MIEQNLARESRKLNLTVIENHDLVIRVRDMLLNGRSRSEIMESISEQFDIKKRELLEYAYQKGVEYFQSRSLKVLDIKVITASHIQEYEELYRKFKELDSNQGMLRSLRQKEGLLGYHSESRILEINQQNTTIIESNEEEEYNLSKLSKEEFIEWEGLMKKVTDNE